MQNLLILKIIKTASRSVNSKRVVKKNWVEKWFFLAKNDLKINFKCKAIIYFSLSNQHFIKIRIILMISKMKNPR